MNATKTVLIAVLAAGCGEVTASSDAGGDIDGSSSELDGSRADAPPAPDASPPDGGGGCLSGSVCLTGTPDPGNVLSIDHCYFYDNNLVNSIWHRPTNLMITGHYEQTGHWAFQAETGGYPASPDVGSEDVNRLVHVPATNVVVHSGNNQFAAAMSTHSIGTISPNGEMSGFTTIDPSDNFDGNCNLISASANEFLCFDGGAVRHYATQEGSAAVTLTKEVTLEPAPSDLCDAHCFGGTFAWDGMFYYFPVVGGSAEGVDYEVFDADGALVNTFSAPGGGNVNGIYFDWSIGRYATHDGFGARSGGQSYVWAQGTATDDSQCYSATSPAHTFTP